MIGVLFGWINVIEWQIGLCNVKQGFVDCYIVGNGFFEQRFFCFFVMCENVECQRLCFCVDEGYCIFEIIIGNDGQDWFKNFFFY